LDTQSIKAYLLDDNPDAALFDGFDCALIGAGSWCTEPPVAVYSQKAIMEKLGDDGFADSMAVDFFEHLVAQNFGANTPIILRDLME
jgi:hypothetical protein